MKTKIIGLAAIMLALVMATGMASAQMCPFAFQTKIGAEGGHGWVNQSLVIANDYFTKDNLVNIGNINVTAVCPYSPTNLTEALEGVNFNIADSVGSGVVQTGYGLYPGGTFQFVQAIDATKAIVVEQEDIGDIGCDPTQDLLLGTEGTMNYYEFKEIGTSGDLINVVKINQTATLNASSALVPNSVAFNLFNATDQFDFKITQVACGEKIPFEFLMTIPPLTP